MKKITFCFAMLLVAVFSSFGQVQIGDGALIDKGVPFEPSRAYNYTQSIYLASEVLATGSITSLQWYYAGNNDLAGSQELTIYIGHTTKTLFSSASNWEPIGNLTQVYTGGVAANGPGWLNFSLDTPFAYNGVDNLVIAVKEISALSDYSEDDFYTYQVIDNRSLTLSSNSTIPNTASPANGTLRKFVPIITIDGISQACPKPIQVVANEVTTTGVTLNWNSMIPTPGASEYYISATNTAPTATTEATGDGTTGDSQAVITTGLLPATKYYAWVRDVCEGGPGVWSNMISFTTACEPTGSFYQNFNSAANSTVPVCWTSVVYHPQGNATPSKVEVTNEDGYTGKSVQFYRAGDPDSEMILVSPPISNLGASTHRLRFFAKNVSFIANGTFKVGTMDGNTMDANFNQLAEFSTTSTFTEYIVDFTSVSTQDTYIAIKSTGTNENYLGYIDDIRWEVAPLCPDVIQVGVPSVTTTTATVAWTSEDLTEWEVVYGTSATADPNTLTPVISALQNPTALIEGLTAETTYQVWVRSKCSAGTGFWVGPVAFKTACQPVNNLNENFDSVTGNNLPNCWTKILRGQTLSPYATIRTIMDGVNSAPRAIELYSGFSNPAASDDIILVSPNLGNLDGGTHRLKFFARGEGILEVGTLSGNTPSSQFESFQAINISNPTMAMNEYVVDFATYTDTNTFIGFRFATTSSFKTIVLDDIIWEISPSCPDTNNITFSETTPTSTIVGWPGVGATQWQIVYGAPSVTDPNTLTPSAILTSPSAELNNLSVYTTYKVWVRSVCDEVDGNGAWSYPVYVTTACNDVNTFSETFESAVDPNLPSCWSALIGSDTTAGMVSLVTWQPYAGTKGVEVYAMTASLASAPVLVSRPLGNLNAGTHQVRFFARHSDTANLEVGTVNADGDTFTPLQFLEMTDTYQEYTVDFTNYTGTDKYIGFRISTTVAYKTVSLDNIVWEAAPAPSCVNVTNVDVSDITTTSADVTWTAGSNETGWQYVYAESTVTDPSTLTPSTTLDDEIAELSGLTNATSYNVWVRSVCGSTAFGSWVGPVTFFTKCEASNLPYTEDFESVIVPNLPNCSSILNSVDNVNWVTENNPGNGFTSKALSYGPNETNSGNAWFFTRGINLTAGENYLISYKYGNNSAGLHESLQVKYGTSETVEGMTLTIADHADVTGATLQTSSVPFTVPTTGVYYFGFNAYSAANQWKLFVDDISIEVNLSNGGGFDSSDFMFYPNPVKDVLNLSYNQNISNVAVYNLLGQKVLENTINSNTAKVNLSEFASGNYIIKVTSENQTKVIKVIKE